MDPRDAALRDQLFLAKLTRYLAKTRVRRESATTRQLHAEFHAVVAESRRLRRRAAWLRRTGKSLPRVAR